MQIILLARIGDVNEMIWYIAIFLKILTGAESHSAINLTRVCRDNLTADGSGNRNGPARLTRRCRPDYRY